MTGTLAPAFADALSAALDIAALSPSSHNCQPWGLARMASPPGPARRSRPPSAPHRRPAGSSSSWPQTASAGSARCPRTPWRWS
ncbi:hypothetical protein [Actinomadura madurae]|uniref:hypothetical protein n=1 Tax=Actinomadura madurae TaxID=1993 RepID=UPI0020D2082F|nr:hypothetical protein [Actinomadura madurae]MCP9979071.1 hypothetical protein [Actinomadura madurae]